MHEEGDVDSSAAGRAHPLLTDTRVFSAISAECAVTTGRTKLEMKPVYRWQGTVANLQMAFLNLGLDNFFAP